MSCPTSSRVLERILAAHPFDVTMIVCHGWWPGPTDPYHHANAGENIDRINFYGVNYVPHVFVDGVIDGEYSGPWEDMVRARREVESPLLVELSGQMLGTSTGELSATVRNTSAASVSGVLQFVLIEDDLSHEGKPYAHVMRDFVPDAAGEPIVLAPDESIVRAHGFTIDGAWVRENLEAIVFVQDPVTREVFQAGRIFFELDEPELVVSGQTLDDGAGGDGDGRLDPGETVSLSHVLANLNPNEATGILGSLSSPDPAVTILDADGAWPAIPSGGTGENTADAFSLALSPDAPTGFETELTLALTADPTYDRSIELSLPVGSPEHAIGPDAYGYHAYEDSDPLDQSPAFDWVEIDPTLGGPGTLVDLNDNETVRITLPFIFRYYGVDQVRVSVCSNGWLTFEQTQSTTNENGHIPTPEGPPTMVAMFWTDLDPTAEGSGRIYFHRDTANHRFVLQYSGVEHRDDDDLGEPETFQVILYDPAVYETPTGDGEILVQYADVRDASLCTAGIEDGTQTIGIQVQALGQVNVATSGLVSGRAIRYTTTPASMVGVDQVGAPPGPTRLRARPNPFRGTATIQYELPASGRATIQIFGLDGSVVRTLLGNASIRRSGSLIWDGRTEIGDEAPPGLYFVRLRSAGYELSHKIIRLR